MKVFNQSLSIKASAIGHIAKTIALFHHNVHDLARQEIVKIDNFHLDKHKFLLNVVQVVFDIPKLELFINDCFQSILFSFSEEYDK